MFFLFQSIFVVKFVSPYKAKKKVPLRKERNGKSEVVTQTQNKISSLVDKQINLPYRAEAFKIQTYTKPKAKECSKFIGNQTRSHRGEGHSCLNGCLVTEEYTEAHGIEA